MIGWRRAGPTSYPAAEVRRDVHATQTGQAAAIRRRNDPQEHRMPLTTGHPAAPAATARNGAAETVAPLGRRDPRYQAYAMLRLAFTVAPIAFGLDKFFNVLVDWPVYLAPWTDDILPGSAQDVMYLVGAVEIAAGVLVAIAPRYGAYVVAAWLAGIIVNLLTHSGYYDIALRDFGLMIGALSLARLASVYDARPER
jgi:hypothetical protein